MKSAVVSSAELAGKPLSAAVWVRRHDGESFEEARTRLDADDLEGRARRFGERAALLGNKARELRMSTRAQRQALAERLPWVRRLSMPWPCDGIKWSLVAGRDIYAWGPKGVNPPRGIPARARCKKTARWSYRHLRPAWRRGKGTSKFCWDHLIAQGIYGSMEEEQRAARWFGRHPEVNEP